MSDPRLEYLLDRYFDEALTPEECQELDRVILASPKARELFWKRQRFHAGLRQWGEQAWGQQRALEVLDREPQTEQNWWARQAVQFWFAAAAVLALTAGAWLFLRNGSVFAEQSTSAVAVLTQAADVKWAGTTPGPKIGTSLAPGWLRLEAGLVQLEFISGARVILEGPAEFQIVSPMEGFCRAGVLTAEVPPQAHGFTVRSPGATVVDVGTAFGLSVKDGGVSDVQVLRGEVQLHRATERSDLSEGQAVRVTADGAVSTLASLDAVFPSLETLAQRADAGWKRRREEWMAAMARFDADPALLVRYTFESGTSWSRTLQNSIRSATKETTGAIVGSAWSSGRWPGKRALEFRGINDRVRFQVPGEFQAITLAAWVCVDSLKLDLNGLMMTDGFDAGELHWQLTRSGAIRLGVGGGGDFNSPPVFTTDALGRWVHLAVVCDRAGGTVSHYVDGKQVFSRPLTVGSPLRIGDAELGNWNPGGRHDSRPVRNLDGRMDEFCLFTRALEAGEISQLHASGRAQ